MQMQIFSFMRTHSFRHKSTHFMHLALGLSNSTPSGYNIAFFV